MQSGLIQEKRRKNTRTKKSMNNWSTKKVPTSKVDKYPDWDKRMLGIRCGKAAGKSPVNPINII